MIESDRKRFGEIMFGMAETIQGATLTKMGLDVRFDALKEYSIREIGEAATRLLKTHSFNFMPNVKDFADAIEGVSGILPVEDKAEVEAGKVLEHLHLYGAATSPKFDDPVTRQLMKGRWRYGSWASYVLESDLKWWKKDFVRAYKAHSAMERIENLKLQDIANGAIKSIPSKKRGDLCLVRK